MNINQVLSNLKRPKSLVRAARMALLASPEDTHAPQRRASMETLLSREADLETDRKLGQASYRAQDHVRIMAAILQEALRQRQVKA